LYAGPDYAFSNYKTFGDTSSSNYAKKRKESTGFSSAYSAGARFTKVFNNAMSLRTGVNYSQINEKFKYINLAEIRFITVITTRVIIRAPGDTIYINDTLRYQQSGSRVKTTYNKYRSIDIPLMFGYEMGNGKLHANLSAGAIINIYSWYKGDVLDSLYQPVSITTGKNSSQYQYKTNIGVGFITSVSVYYKLNDKWHLLLEPYFRYNLSPMSKENLNLQQRYHAAGLRAGIRLDLGQRK
ncbi:MAG: outer membrane beta-barrel protein, partial [Chitinophagaceae bacterium]